MNAKNAILTEQTLWPIGRGFVDEVRAMVAWCELGFGLLAISEHDKLIIAEAMRARISQSLVDGSSYHVKVRIKKSMPDFRSQIIPG